MKIKSYLEKLSPSSIGKNLWGRQKMPLRWKLLFTAQSFIFVSALFMRQNDVNNAQRRKLEMAKEDTSEVESSAVPIEKANTWYEA